MKLIIFIALCLCAASSFAQNTYSIKGTATDSVSKAALPVTVTVLNAKDSVLRKFTHTAADGSFTITGLPAGRFILLATNSDYNEFAQRFTLDPATKEHNFGNIKMHRGATMLKEVKIKDDAPAIKIKGDTIEFNAKKYVIQPNDKVEDLLKQLPGITIDKDGHITSEGERITHVLLDGEEFFGDDPTLITRNIRSDMVDKIQLYTQKSDMAIATGIDDGKGRKTINVQLKQDKRTGVFGKVLGGAGNDSYYEGQGFVNKFTPNYKTAAYGTISNDGKVGLGGADNSRLGMNNLMVIGVVGGSVSVSSGSNSQLDRESYGGKGLPESKTGGAHYDTKLDNGTETINANYKAGDLSTTIDQRTLSRTTYPTSVQDGDNVDHTVSDLNRQKVDAIFTKRLATTGNLQVDVNASVQNNHDLDAYNASTTSEGTGDLLNKNSHYQDTKTQERTINANIMYRKTFIKSKTTFSWQLQEGYDQSNSTEYLKNDVVYPSTGSPEQLTDQYKPTISSGLALASRMGFSKTLGKGFGLALNYEITLNNSSSDQRSYDASSAGVYNVLDTAFSSNYKLSQLSNLVGLTMSYSNSKNLLNFGAGATNVNFNQTNEYTGYIYKRDFVNWNPHVLYLYHLGQSKTVQFQYNGNSQQPSISQVQPVPNNNNPLNITIGNPDLKPYFTNNLNGSYSATNQLTGEIFRISSSYSFTADPIVNNTILDTAKGTRTTQFINLTGKTQSNYNVNVSYSRKIVPLDMQVTGQFGANSGVSYTNQNGILAKYTSHGYGPAIVLRKDKLKKYSLSLDVNPNWAMYNYFPTVLPNSLTFNCNITAEGTVYLPGKLQVTSYYFERIRGPINNLPSTTVTDWTAGFSRTFLKDDALKLSLTCNNLLNEGGFLRMTSANEVSQNTSNSIKRFFLVSVSWDFAHFPSVPVK